jgi:hypothetical protein
LYTQPSWRTSSECVLNGCLAFDGTDDAVVIANNSNLIFGTGDFTVSVWIKFPISGSNNWSGIIAKGVTTGAPAHTWGLLRRNTDTNRVAFLQSTDGGGTWGVDIESTTLSNGWHLIVVKRNNQTAQIYVDGQYLTQDTSAGDDLSTTDPLTIGRSNVFTSGLIDDIRIYDIAMPTSQIEGNYYIGINNLYKNNEISLDEFSQRLVELKSNIANNE